MNQVSNLTSLITENVAEVQKGGFEIKEIYNDTNATKGKNEFLFFIKPEITLPVEGIQLGNILDTIQEKIKAFGLTIHNVKVLSASYLEKYNIIAQHYGVINKIASDAVNNMSQGAKEKFAEIFGKSVSEAKVLGGVEFLQQYPDFNANSLDFLLQNTGAQKLAGGTYCAPIKMDTETVYVVNGFHPRQLIQFTEKGRSIVVMTLSGDVSWKEARTNFIGATNPESAAEGSLRRTFLENKESFGLAEVSQGVNGVHLSAGPVEGLIELKRYNTDFTKGEELSFEEFSFGKALKDNFNAEQVQKITNNENVMVDGKAVSIFDITEEMDAVDAIAKLKEVL